MRRIEVPDAALNLSFALTEVDLLCSSLKAAGEPGLAMEALVLRSAIQARRYLRFPTDAEHDDRLRAIALAPLEEEPEPVTQEAPAHYTQGPWQRLLAWLRG